MEELKENNIEETLNIITTGCVHGNLDKMYNDIEEYSKKNKKKIDLVLCTGDFESMRTENDLTFLSCPEKYREMGDFHKYFTLKSKAPYLTIFIGGNHEASNFLEQNYYGGWVAQNIYYLGRSGVINVKGIRIGGFSGIFNKYDYFRGNYEKNERDIRGDKKSIFHLREFEVCKMSHVKNKIDIFMTHDWPTNIISDEDKPGIIKLFSHNKDDIENGLIGSFPGEFILKHLKPIYFICGHMHFYYSNKVDNTQIFAFDKCLKKRKYFDLIEVKKSITSMDIKSNDIYIEPEWMAITNVFNEYNPSSYENYSFYKLFEENSKELYSKLVLNKMKCYFKYNMNIDDLEQTINNLLINKFTKREKIKEEFENQTELLLSIFDINKEDNHHYLSYMYLEFKYNKKKGKNNKKTKNPDEIDFEI